MRKYTPVPRTLSNAVLKVVTGPLDPARLISPDELKKYPPLLEPDVLFENVQIQADEESKENASPERYKSPSELFGDQSIAPAGNDLKMPTSLKEILKKEE